VHQQRQPQQRHQLRKSVNFPSAKNQAKQAPRVRNNQRAAPSKIRTKQPRQVRPQRPQRQVASQAGARFRINR
jgi:hypothetical protein